MKFLKNIKQDYIIIGVVSLIAFIVGCLSVNFLLSFLVIGIADAVFFIPIIIKKKKKPIKARHKSIEKNKSNKNKIENKRVATKGKKAKKSFWKKLLIIFFILSILGIIAGGAFAAYIVVKSPKFNPNRLYHQEASILYDKNGDIIGKLGSENREIISYDDLPEVLVDAIIATEDSRFFQHNGFDLPRFSVATAKTVLGSSNAGGASTLTMQVVKNHFTSSKQTMSRKFTDIYMSIYKVEKNYTKEEIIEFYVNAPYLGASSYGVEQASQTYFGKSAKNLNLAEAAMIAGIFQSPITNDPIKNPKTAEARRQIVLKLMERHGYITKEEKEIAASMTVDTLLKKNASTKDNKYQVFIDTVVSEVQKQTKLNPYSTAMEIYTTMDPDKQDYINDIMNGKKWDWQNSAVTAGIAVVDVKDGSLAAVGGGRDKSKQRSFNTATMLNNQIGSTAKPLYDYGVGIEYENWSTYQPFTDENISYSDGTKISNWDGSYKGFLTTRTALAQSRNTSALKAFKANKNANINKFVTSLGLSPENDAGFIHEAHAIGGYNGESPLTVAGAYAAFANGGYYIEPHSYTKIINRNTKEVINRDIKKTKVMSEQTAYMMTNLLVSAAKIGVGTNSINGITFGAKTGTSNFDSATAKAKGLPSSAINDYWVDGITSDYAISLWYGYTKVTSKNHNSFGTTYHTRLFKKVASGIFEKGSKFTNPGNVKSIAVESETYPAKLPSEYTPKDKIVTELFKSGTEPTEVSDRYSKLADIKNLTGSVVNNTLTLTWTPIEKPSAIKADSIQKLAKSLFETKGFQSSFIAARNSYNNRSIGNLVYKVYAKSLDGNLTLVGTTPDSSINIAVNPSSSSTYVVKSSYAIFTSNISNGVETTVSLTGVSNLITMELKDANPFITTIGKYAEPGVTIYENGIATSYTPNVISYVNISTNLPVTLQIMNSTPGSYTAEYTYGSTSIKRNITIK